MMAIVVVYYLSIYVRETSVMNFVLVSYIIRTKCVYLSLLCDTTEEICAGC